MTRKKQKKSSRAVLPQNKQEKANRRTEAVKKGKRPVVLTLLFLWGKTLIGTVLLGLTLFFASWVFLFPKPEIKVTNVFESSVMSSYTITITNRSVMNINQLAIAFRFDEEYPVTTYHLDEPQFKTGFVLKHGFVSRLRVSTGDIVSEKPFYNPFKYSSGIQAVTNRLSPGSSATIYVNIDKTYNGPKEQVFPTSLKHSLRSNSYYITFQHMPFGDFAPIAITREGCYDFDGQKTKADNYGKIYEQSITGPDGSVTPFRLPVTKDKSVKEDA